ncbi:RNA pyrophosphohydrolase [Bosea sp. (in: a-proteobacteria)]|jgi:putative (di)nucleoside polyphosphate hydrolase|uniref:RNA pyrophosphohydrolase n=1 Tax=Bosea sp. (in: a-proteobacteria) TaxID=1871050 RepID=UPI002DDD5FCC|nr:RNA pyrophosphohydrolase [Bosea sp. (in: a-proteobacteria)]HEV2510527.1 RNA pyrophosphohydrolase [Bosea sp. (in: a-proteobacteria)]
MIKPPAGYRPCVGLALFNPAGLVFVGRRANRSQREHTAPGHEWQMPQGGIDAGEQPIEAAYRELREETNVSSVSLLAEAPDWLSYDLPREIGREAWRGKYRGQSQKWFAFRFDGDESEIDILNPGGGHKPEFDAWRWVPLAETAELIIPFKREVYREVVRQFASVAR